jgi:hypothetical protein
MIRLFEKWNEKGNVTVIALMMLSVLTLLGIVASRTATTDIQIAGNVIPYKRNFYIAEGGICREAAELGRGEYPVLDVQVQGVELATHESASLPEPAPHEVAGTAYDFAVQYEGFFLSPKGYSVLHFSRYDYGVEATAAETVNVASRYYKIGPKAE